MPPRSDGPFCACTTVTYDPIDHGGGTWSERWRCKTCGTEFRRSGPAERELAEARAERDRLAAEVDRLSSPCERIKAKAARMTDKEAAAAVDNLAKALGDHESCDHLLEAAEAERDRLREALRLLDERATPYIIDGAPRGWNERELLCRAIDNARAALAGSAPALAGDKLGEATGAGPTDLGNDKAVPVTVPRPPAAPTSGPVASPSEPEPGVPRDRFVWIPEERHQGVGGPFYAAVRPELGFWTMDPHNALQFATKDECDVFCAMHPRCVSREHGFIAPPAAVPEEPRDPNKDWCKQCGFAPEDCRCPVSYGEISAIQKTARDAQAERVAAPKVEDPPPAGFADLPVVVEYSRAEYDAFRARLAALEEVREAASALIGRTRMTASDPKRHNTLSVAEEALARALVVAARLKET